MQIALQNYVKNSQKSGLPPLPILNRIHQGYLPLISYSLNKNNTTSFSKSAKYLVPDVLTKLYLVNNSLKDADTAMIISGLSECKQEGLQGLGIMRNGLSVASFDAIAEKLIPSNIFAVIKKFILKDPNPIKIAVSSLSRMIESMAYNHDHIAQLRVLCLSRLGLDMNCVKSLAKAL